MLLPTHEPISYTELMLTIDTLNEYAKECIKTPNYITFVKLDQNPNQTKFKLMNLINHLNLPKTMQLAKKNL